MSRTSLSSPDGNFNTGTSSTTWLPGNFTSEKPGELQESTTTLLSTDSFSPILDNQTTEVVTQILDNFTTGAPSKLLDNFTTGAPSKLLDNFTTGAPSKLLDNFTTGVPSKLLDNLTTVPPWFLDNTTTIRYDTPTKEPVPECSPFCLKFRDEPWVIPLVTLSFMTIAAILVFEVYVLYKSCGSKRHLFMGQILLFGIFLASVLGLVYVPEPHWVLCGITRAGLGVIYSIIFGSLLVKCVFLLKLHNGVYLNASTQGLLLFFTIAVQVAIVSQWLVYDPPRTIQSLDLNDPPEVCKPSPLVKIEYLSYVMFLLFLVIIASIKARNLRENNREALYVGISIGVSLVLWVAWISVALVFNRRYEAPAEALGLVCTAMMVFVMIFVPKAMQLAARHSNGSSDSRSVLNTPSFMHLQPHAVIPIGGQDTVVKHSSLNADFCRGYPSRMWRYDYPSFQQMEPAVSDIPSLKKSNFSNSHTN